MSDSKKARPSRTQHHLVSEFFEEHVTNTLRSQDEMLDKLDKKLSSPILNGGYDTLMQKVDKIEVVQDQLKEHGPKIDAIHVAIFDPEKGLYGKVKENSSWINRANIGVKTFGVLLATGILTGFGKILYDMFTGHIKYVP